MRLHRGNIQLSTSTEPGKRAKRSVPTANNERWILRSTMRVWKYFSSVRARTCYAKRKRLSETRGYEYILTITLHAKFSKVRKDLPVCVISRELLNVWKFVPENSTYICSCERNCKFRLIIVHSIIQTYWRIKRRVKYILWGAKLILSVRYQPFPDTNTRSRSYFWFHSRTSRSAHARLVVAKRRSHLKTKNCLLHVDFFSKNDFFFFLSETKTQLTRACVSKTWNDYRFVLRADSGEFEHSCETVEDIDENSRMKFYLPLRLHIFDLYVFTVRHGYCYGSGTSH